MWLRCHGQDSDAMDRPKRAARQFRTSELRMTTIGTRTTLHCLLRNVGCLIADESANPAQRIVTRRSHNLN